MLTKIRISLYQRRRYAPLNSLTIAVILLVMLNTSPINCEEFVEFKLGDNTGPEHFIGNIGKRAFSLNKKYLSVHLTQKRDYFRIDDSSNLYTTNTLDRDAVCKSLDCCSSLTCSIDLEALLIENSANSQHVKVRILLSDVNDNAPIFSRTNYEVEILESTSVDTEMNLPVKAKDMDSPMFGIERYQLSDDSTFILNDKNPNNLKLKLKRALDRESQDSYDLIIRAIDKGTPPKIGKATLTIRVTDANDNKPEFRKDQQKSQTMKILENSPSETFLKQFIANDKDEKDHPNSQVTYEIGATSTPEGLATKKFEIDAQTGRLTLKSPVDYENALERKFTLYIVAKDNGSPRLSSMTTLNVLVQNVNDNQLKFEITHKKDVHENNDGEENELVAMISVSDDDDMTTMIKCSLKDDRDFDLKNYSQRLYGLTTKHAFDYEVQKEAIAVIRCKESDPDSLPVEKSIPIKILDENDNIPKFDKHVYSIQVNENTPVNTAILKLNVTDKDSEQNGELSFNFSATNDAYLKSYISITQSGSVILMKKLDRETIQRLRFIVQATDKGEPKLHSTAELILEVTDYNDNAPVYYGPRHFYIDENPVDGTELTRLDFRDSDINENGQIEYRLVSHTPVAANWFKLFENKLIAYSPIDREKASNITLIVEAKDLGKPPQTTQVTLHVSIMDINDNKPKLMFPKNNTLIRPDAPIPRNFPKGSYITQLNVVDGDNGQNGTVSFKIRRSNASEGTFSIGAEDGRLLTNWDENSQPDMGVYYVQIVIEDDGKPKKLHDIVIFYINVTTSMYQGIGSDPNLSNMIILILIVICSVALIISLIAAIFWVRFRINRPESRLPSGYISGGQLTKNYCDGGQPVHFYQPADMQPDYHVMDFNMATSTLPKKDSLRLQTISRHDDYFPMDNLGHSTYCPNDGTMTMQGPMNPTKPLPQCVQCIPGQYPSDNSGTLPMGYTSTNTPLLPPVSSMPMSSATLSAVSTLPATSSSMGNGPPPYYTLHLNTSHHSTLQPHGREQPQPSNSHLLQVNGNGRGASSGKTERRLSDQSYSDSGKGGSLEDLTRFNTSTSTFGNHNHFGHGSGSGVNGSGGGVAANGTTTAALGSKLERIRGMQAAAAAAAAIAAASQANQAPNSTTAVPINSTATLTNRNPGNSLRSTLVNGGGSTSTLTGVTEQSTTSSPSAHRVTGSTTSNSDKNKQYYIDRANTPETMC